jgi:hypothetical protein
MLLKFDNVPESLSKDWIISKIPEEAIFNFYGLTVQDGKFCSPLRADNRPTCNFYRDNNNVLMYRDWATNHHFDAIGFVKWKYGISYGQALSRIYNDMINHNPGKPGQGTTVHIVKKKASEIRIKRRPFNQSDIYYWQQFGISTQVLDIFNVSAIQRAWVNNEPVYLYNQSDVCYAYRFGAFKYKLYFPMRKEYRFLSSSSDIQGWNQLPDKGDWVVITKSLKDVMLLYTFGIPAIALSTEAQVPSNELITKLKERFTNIVLFYDNDERGISSMQKAKTSLPCMWIPKRYEVKDITDYYSKYGRDATYELIFYAKRKLEYWKLRQN